MKRQRYDVALKISVVNEYIAGGITYASLTAKYGIPRATIAKWIQKAKRHQPAKITTAPEPRFLNITPALRESQNIGSKQEVSLTINGLEIRADLATITKLLLGAKDV